MQEEPQNGGLAPNEEIDKPRTSIRGFGVALILFAADIAVKLYAVRTAPDFGNWWFKFKLFYNEGIVFSLPVPNWIYLPVALAIFMLFAGALIMALKKRSVSAPWLTFVVLGALSNLIDRFAHGATIDYLLFFGRSAVNLADAMIVIGVILFIRSQKKPPKADPPPQKELA